MIHLITGEYPPSRGGVADYTAVVAAGLAQAGVAVHVWCPGDGASAVTEGGVVVHRALGRMDRRDLRRAGEALDAVAPPRRLIVQWVPHAFGQRALNIGFCRWARARARAGDRVEIVVHEPFLPFAMRPAHLAAAVVQRVMTAILLRAAAHVWVVTPAWEARWRPYAFGRAVPFTWLPEPASIPVTGDAAAATAVRARAGPAGTVIVGSFSCGGGFARRVLERVAPAVLERHPVSMLLLIGAGSTAVRDGLVERHCALAGRIHATGALDGPAVSAHLAACDVAVQPYPDGICTRHSSAMTVLAHALPMVTTTGRFTEGVWHESGAACLVDSHAVGGLSAEIDRLLSDEPARRALAARAIDTYRKHFDLRHTVAALLSEHPCV